MQELLLQIISHPFEDVEVLMSLWGAFGVLAFFWGFFGYFLSHGHIDHQDHARTYMIWGTILTASAIFVWEGIRFLTGFFNGAQYSGLGIFLGVTDIIFIVIVLIMAFTAKPKGGH